VSFFVPRGQTIWRYLNRITRMITPPSTTATAARFCHACRSWLRQLVTWLPCKIINAGPLENHRYIPRLASATKGWAEGSWKVDIFMFVHCWQIWSNGWNYDCDALRDAGIGPAMRALAAERQELRESFFHE